MIRTGRRGMSLMEVMVVIALVMILLAVLIPSTRSIFEVHQREGAKRLAATYEQLHDEAVMRNRSFRINFYLDEDRYEIEAGEPGALIAATPEDRERFEQELKSKLSYMSDEEKVAYLKKSEQPFEALNGPDAKMNVHLPGGVHFGGFYTPQYGRVIKPGEVLDPDREDKKLVVHSFVMNSGFSEHTIIWLVDEPGATDGWTVEVEPLSGAVRMTGELLTPDTDFKWLPEEGPSLPR
ncbi:MAG: prepilin-type N-terminal cleavage/methylation domain-containing protein [Alphaproteobacteria bacterium]|nr:prepilin-type N-terminal cleavage/methylation domain-containing protein [Alphaproteobacteria bacterium]